MGRRKAGGKQNIMHRPAHVVKSQCIILFRFYARPAIRQSGGVVHSSRSLECTTDGSLSLKTSQYVWFKVSDSSHQLTRATAGGLSGQVYFGVKLDYPESRPDGSASWWSGTVALGRR